MARGWEDKSQDALLHYDELAPSSAARASNLTTVRKVDFLLSHKNCL